MQRNLLISLTVAVLASFGFSIATVVDSQSNSRDLLLVTEDYNSPRPGCDAVSVFDMDGNVQYQGLHQVSPGRLAATDAGDVVIAQNANHNFGEPFVYVLRRSGPAASGWSTTIATGADFTERGGIAVMPDNDTFVAALGDNAVDGASTAGTIAAFSLSDAEDGTVGLPMGSRQLSGVAAEIIAASAGRVHVLDVSGASMTVRTLSVPLFTEPLASVDLEPLVVSSGANAGPRLAHAATTGDGRYLLVNRWRSNEIQVVDLVERRSWLADLPSDIKVTGGVAVHDRLIAVHANEEIVLFELINGRLESRGRIGIQSPGMTELNYVQSGPHLSVAWSPDGDRLFAASSDGDAEFVAIRVADGGMRLSIDGMIEACRSDDNAPQDILTVRAKAAVAQPTETRQTTTPQPTDSPTPACVCSYLHGRVPAAVINHALASPESYFGWMLRRDPGKPPGPANPPRQCLTLLNPNVDYHVSLNPPVWRVGCG